MPYPFGLRFITRQPRSLLLPFPWPAGLSTAGVNLSSPSTSQSQPLASSSLQPLASALSRCTSNSSPMPIGIVP
ncbi:hypothetical protein AXF42_Ash009868 [Apostasia shenzhenica]|uniref:Uncharacterized protein n=1 Tax=Apostasia shenzhenica TaxID=1088818 RepID=A0A2I0AC64_9ASPA|nr:hypothetical protein AXF42_Ash009868 [Apostasia shenzhenica]